MNCCSKIDILPDVPRTHQAHLRWSALHPNSLVAMQPQHMVGDGSIVVIVKIIQNNK